jgi:hypothetical protein
MMTCWPEPYPDEIVYSIIARMQHRKRYPHQRILVQEVFGTDNVAAVVDLPSHLDMLVSRLPPGVPYGADQLIDYHTLLPFYQAFLPAHRVQRLRADMRGTNGQGIHTRLGLMASRVPMLQWLKYCSYCVAADREHRGECYWHREHQLDGVHLCPTHAIPLEKSTVSIRSNRTRYEFVCAEEAIPMQHVNQMPSYPDEVHEALLAIARDAAWLLHNSVDTTLETIQQRYLLLLAEHDLATMSGSVRATKLLQDFTDHYPSELLSLLHCELDIQSGDTWLLRLVRKPDSAQHPVQHMLLIHFLGHTVESFFRYHPDCQPFGAAGWPCLNPVCEQYHLPSIQSCAITYSRYAGGKPIGTFTCTCGFSYTRTGPDQQPEDRFRRDRILQFGSIWHEHLRTCWADPAFSLRQIARLLGVDPATIKAQAAHLDLPFPRPGGRVLPEVQQQDNGDTGEALSQRDAYRAIWLQARAEHPDKGRKALRQNVAPGVYTWLYRHDRAWLEVNSPPRQRTKHSESRIDWHERDAQWAVAVGEAAAQVRAAPGKPRRMTLSAIGKAIGQLGVLQKHLDKLPLTSAALQEVVETREVWAVRRIEQVATQAAQDGETLPRWQLIKRAGVERLLKQEAIQQALDHALNILNCPE